MAANVYKINGNGVRIPIVNGDPSAPENGMIWYNSALNVFRKHEAGVTADMAQDDIEALDIPYDNVASGLTATTVQAAIDEIDDRVDDLELAFSAAVNAGAIDVSCSTSDTAGTRYLTAMIEKYQLPVAP